MSQADVPMVNLGTEQQQGALTAQETFAGDPEI